MRASLRVWVEFLPYEEARHPDVISFLKAHDLQPIFAVRPDSDLDALVRLIRDTDTAGLRPMIWPLLSHSDGYWPGESNAERWWAQTEWILDTLAAQMARPAGVAVDLEPPIDHVQKLARAVPGLDVLRLLWSNLDRERFEDSVRQWTGIADALHERRLDTLAVAFSAVASDLNHKTAVWQDLLETPWADVAWKSHGIMAYGSLVTGYSKGLLGADDARAIHHHLITPVQARWGAGSHVSMGLVGTGVLGDEPTYASPHALALDAAAVRAAGVTDLGLFCLEGILSRDDPESWVEAVWAMTPVVPSMTYRSRAVRILGRGARNMAGFVRRG